MTCKHKNLNDHSFPVANGARHWTCSHCCRTGPWSDGWGYFGSIECKHCWMARIDFVYCSEACRQALAKTYGIAEEAPKPANTARASKPRKVPAWEHKAIAAGWTPPKEAP